VGDRSLGSTATTIAAICLTAALLASCATNDDATGESTPSPTPTDQPTAEASESPDPDATVEPPEQPESLWRRALDATALSGSADIDAQLITNVEGFERITQGDGWVDITTGSGDITWIDDRSTTREVRSPTGHYLDLDGTWFAVAEGLPTTVAFEPLDGLAAPASVQVEGTEDVLGIATTKLTAELPADGSVMGFSSEETTVFDPMTGSLLATIWVDDDDRIVRVLREYATDSLDGDFVEAVTLFVFSDFGVERPLDIPATADAIPAPV